MIRTLAHQELGGGYSHGPKIIVDTSELERGVFETMALRPDGTEIESRKTRDEKQALTDFREVLMNQAGPIQRAFLEADMKLGERYTLFRFNEFGSMMAEKIEFGSMALTTYAQHRDAVSLVYRPARGRNDRQTVICHGSFAICRGWQDLPENFGYEIKERGNGVTVSMSKYCCFDARFFEDLKPLLKDVLVIREDYRTGVNGKVYA